VYRESKGISLLEAWAAGVPAVLPAHGAFPEMSADTGGALLYGPGNAAEAAATLRRLLTDSSLRAEMGAQAARAIRDRHQAEAMALRTRALYAGLLAG
jgi:glycosyltransferase involved in cell wall biosynthesis